MATDDRKIQLGVSVDATEARQGFNDVKSAARDMAQAVVTQGNTAGKAVDSIGSGGAASAQKVDSATRSMIQSIQRTTAAMDAGSKSSSAYFEALAAQRGIPTDALAPYLAQLDAAKKKQDAASESLHSFSLNSTRARTELVVLGHELLQGNFSRFGGSMMVMAEATDALSVALSPVGLGIGVVAAAIGGLAVAAYKGHEESEKLRNSLILTGNAAGVTANSFALMARSIADDTGKSMGTARNALQGLASTGQFTGNALKLAGEDVVKFSELSGESLDKVIADYDKMPEGVTKWATEHNRQLNYMNEADYERIKTLEEAGRTEQALMDNLSLLHQHFADTADEKLGYVERAWRAVKNAITDTADALKEIGREQTPEQRVQAAADKRKRSDSGGVTASWENPANLYTARDDADNMAAQMEADKSAAAAFAKSQADADQKAAISAAQSLDGAMKSFDKAYAKAKELKERKAQFVNLYKGNPDSALLKGVKVTGSDEAGYSVSGGTYDQLVADINKKYTEKAPKSTAGLIDKTKLQGEVQAVKDSLTQELSYIKSAQTELDAQYKAGGLSENAYYTQSRELIVQRASDEADAYNKEAAILTKGLTDRKLSAEQRATIMNQVVEMHAKAAKAIEDAMTGVGQSAAEEDAVWQKYGQSQVDATNKMADANEKEAQKLRDQADTYGLTKSALDELLVSRAQSTLSLDQEGLAMARINDVAPDVIANYEKMVEADKKLLKSQQDLLGAQQSDDAAQQIHKQQDDYVKTWQQTIDGIGTDFHDGFLQMLTNGKAGWASFTASLKNTFETTVVNELYKAFAKPMVVSVIANIAGITGGDSVRTEILKNNGMAGDESSGSNGGISNLLSYNNLKTGYNTVSGWLGGGEAGMVSGASSAVSGGLGSGLGGTFAADIGGDVASSTASIAAAEGVGANTAGFTAGSGIGSGLGATGLMYGGAGLFGGLAGGALFGNKGYSSLGGSLGAMGGMALAGSSAVAGSVIGAEIGSFVPLPIVGTVIGMALGALVGSLMGGGETRYGADYTVDGNHNVSMVRGPSGGDPASDQIQASIKGTFDSITSLAQQMGGSVSGLGPYSATYEVSPQKGDSFVAAGFGDLSGYPGRQDLGGVKDSTTVLNDFSLQLQRSVISGLQQANLDKPYSDVLKGVDASKLSASDITSLLNELSSLKSLFDSFNNLGEEFTNLKNASTDAKMNVINLAGGMDGLNTEMTYFAQHFTSAADQTAAQAKSVTDQLTKLGMSGAKTNDQFREAVQGIDLSTAAGQQLYQQMLALAPAFDAMTAAAKQAADAQQALWNQYFNSIYTPDEQAAMGKKQVQAQFDALGVVMPKTNAEFEALVENMDTSTQPMKDLQNALLALAPAFAQVTSAADQAAQAAAQAVQTALGNVQTAYDNQSRAIQGNIDSINQFITSLTSLKQSLALGSLSTLSPQDKYLAEKQLFESTSASAAAGDATAQGNLPQVAQDFLTASQAYNASSQAYVDDYNEVQKTLSANIATAQQQLSAAQQQLNATNQMVQGILNLNQTAMSLSDALKEYFAAGGKTGAAGAAGAGMNRSQVEATADPKTGLIPYSAANPYGPMGGYTVGDWQASMAGGVSDATKAALGMTQGPDGTYGWYPVNGSHAGGLDSVPFDGYIAKLHKDEAVVTSPNNQKLAQMLSMDWSKYGTSDKEGLVDHIKALNDKIAQLERTVASVGVAQMQQSQQQHTESQAVRTKQTRHLQTAAGATQQTANHTGKIAQKR